MGLSAPDRVLEDGLKETGNKKPSDDPIFGQRQNPNQVSPYDPMGQENFTPATGDGK